MKIAASWYEEGLGHALGLLDTDPAEAERALAHLVERLEVLRGSSKVP